jgi:hypothetical protein
MKIFLLRKKLNPKKKKKKKKIKIFYINYFIYNKIKLFSEEKMAVKKKQKGGWSIGCQSN